MRIAKYAERVSLRSTYPPGITSAGYVNDPWSSVTSMYSTLNHCSEEEKKLSGEQETACRDIVNELYHEMESTFSEYKIPPPFFGPLQVVSYEGIGGDINENQEDAEFKINISDDYYGSSMFQSRSEKLAREVDI
jgi:hypothetical protein